MRALVYSLREAPLTLADLHGLPGLPETLAEHTAPSAFDRLELALDDGRVLWQRLAPAALPIHLDALRALIAARELLEPELPATLPRIREAVELVLESESDVDADTFEELVVTLCERVDGFSVWAHGVFDGLGRELLDMREANGAPAPTIEMPSAAPPATGAGLPGAVETVARARALAALARRGVLEAAGPTAEGRAEIENLRRFAFEPAQRAALDAEQAALMGLPPGAWSQRTLVDATWLTEAVAVFAWALGQLPFPPHDEMVESEPLQILFGLGGPVPAPLQQPRLRPSEALRAELDRHTALHDSLAATLARGHTPDQIQTVAGLTTERLRALGWLLGA